MKNEVPFSHGDYLKLINPLFPTIRRRDKYPKVGTTVPISLPEDEFEAMIVFKMPITLKKIPTRFLIYDTARESKVPKNREEAKKVLNSFYQNPIQEHEQVTIIFCLEDHQRGLD